MANIIEESLKQCGNCNRTTKHYRETKQMSWLMHLVLAVFTAGMWLIVWAMLAVYHFFTKPIAGRYICSVCGKR